MPLEPIDRLQLETLVNQIFSRQPIQVERMAEGSSTFVYRIVYPNELFYLRILPEENASFAPEVAVHTRLRQMQVKVPEVIYFEHYNEQLQRSIMVTTEIKGRSISQSGFLDKQEMHAILVEAGQDLAYINGVPVDGFGWIAREQPDTELLRAPWLTHRTFALEYWEADLAFLARDTLHASEITLLEHILAHYDAWLDCEQSYLAHGDFDTTHIYQQDGRYTGIIDFGEIRGTNRWYDLGHFHMRDGEALPDLVLPGLIEGYGESIPLPSNYEQSLCFTSILINVRALARSLQKRPANRYTLHQLSVLRKDLAVLRFFL
ncbi:hypothetical protein KDW_54880 [Dictyobacter vulcani]|uniref:Aminoglycoside phosphotransferase domain-containing protein n=1 Tax=Dictyobacter vulcani TaxID=2607529 RepID=A0A5J4L1H4_9CHLR|nr:aminoglycoside phosphotransferase family protein [Dictyobacter vulcani]GER91326.1 hypothetical protein KDW_54880 [Dictyobacter vulcani]